MCEMYGMGVVVSVPAGDGPFEAVVTTTDCRIVSNGPRLPGLVHAPADIHRSGQLETQMRGAASAVRWLQWAA